jgi:hypothetical protein
LLQYGELLRLCHEERQETVLEGDERCGEWTDGEDRFCVDVVIKQHLNHAQPKQ